MKKDDYLFNMMQEPPKQRNVLAKFDMRTQTEAFTVTAGGIPGVRILIILSTAISSSRVCFFSTT